MECGTVVCGYTIVWRFSSVNKDDNSVIELEVDVPHRQIVLRLEKFIGNLVVLNKSTIMDVLQWLVYNYDNTYLPIGNTAIHFRNFLSNQPELRELNCIFHNCEIKLC